MDILPNYSIFILKIYLIHNFIFKKLKKLIENTTVKAAKRVRHYIAVAAQNYRFYISSDTWNPEYVLETSPCFH